MAAAAGARSKVLVLNAGSSSLKFQVFSLERASAAGVQGASGPGGAWAAGDGGGGGGGGNADGLQAVAAGLCERIGDPSGEASMQARSGCLV